MAKPFLTVILAPADRAAQVAHLARGALFLPEPEPLPEPFAEIVLRVEVAEGKGVELDARVLQILPGHGIAVAFDDAAGAKAKLAPLLAEPAGATEEATFVFWGRPEAAPEAAPEADAPADRELELDERVKLEAEIAAMTTNQKMQLAMRGNRNARTLLLKDVNKNVQTFILQNPRITLDEVKNLAANRQALPDVLNAIAAHKDWGQNPNILIALVRNPKTPGTTAARLIDKVPMAEVRRLAKANDVPRAVMTAARRRVSDVGSGST